ncbi:MAG: hypothetical protein WCJ61_00990 [Paludibacter sp.]
MRKKLFLGASAIMLLLAMNSCKTAAVEPDAPLQFSTQTVEQQKKNIEQSGLDLADKMNGLKETQAMKVLNYLSGGQMGLKAPALVAPLSKLRASLLKNNVNALESFNQQMKSAAIPDSVWGTYTFNRNTEEFDIVKGVKNIAIFKFPADSASTTNNGLMTINYAESTVAIPEMNPVQNYPKSISVVLKVNDTEALNAQFTGEYQTDGTPISIVQTLAIGAYNWSTSATNTTTNVATNFTFKYNTQVLLKYDLGASGSFTKSQIEAINSNAKGPQDLVSGGFMSFQVMNVAVYGGITDTKGFMNEGNALTNNDNKTYTDQSVVIFNKYLKFYGYFVEPKEKFADVEFYSAEELVSDYSNPPVLVYTQLPGGNPPTVKYDYYSYSYSTNGYTYKYYAYPTKIGYNTQPRLVMSDGSKVTDFDKFINDNFSTVIDKFNSMLPQ